MSISKVAISIDSRQLKKIDMYVKKKVFKSRSQAFQQSITDFLEHIEHNRLAKECEKLDVSMEQQMTEMGWDEDSKEWPGF